MSVRIKDLIKLLREKDQNKEVEFVVVSTEGHLVCMDIEANADDLARLLKAFNKGA